MKHQENHLQIINHDNHPWSFLGDVAFLREDQVDKGTLSHELAHFVGTKKKIFMIIICPDCRPFRGSIRKNSFKAMHRI